MFPKKSPRTAQNVRLTKLTPLACTSLESAEPLLKANATMNAKRKVTADKNIRFNANLPKLPKNKPCALNVKSAVTCGTKTAYAYEN
jgi:hypothetical protein